MKSLLLPELGATVRYFDIAGDDEVYVYLPGISTPSMSLLDLATHPRALFDSCKRGLVRGQSPLWYIHFARMNLGAHPSGLCLIGKEPRVLLRAAGSAGLQ